MLPAQRKNPASNIWHEIKDAATWRNVTDSLRTTTFFAAYTDTLPRPMPLASYAIFSDIWHLPEWQNRSMENPSNRIKKQVINYELPERLGKISFFMRGWTLGTEGPFAWAKAAFERSISVPRHKSASGRTTLKFLPI